MTTNEQLKLMDKLQEKLENNILKEKWDLLLNKNPDLKYFRNLNFITCLENEKVYANVPLTTVEVERSFSTLTYILTDLRRNLSVKQLEMLLFLYFN